VNIILGGNKASPVCADKINTTDGQVKVFLTDTYNMLLIESNYNLFLEFSDGSDKNSGSFRKDTRILPYVN
jgi:hypothetical protein